MDFIEKIEKLCERMDLNFERNIFEEEISDTLYVDLSSLNYTSALKEFAAELPSGYNVYYVYAGDDAKEDWQRKLCMVFE